MRTAANDKMIKNPEQSVNVVGIGERMHRPIPGDLGPLGDMARAVSHARLRGAWREAAHDSTMGNTPAARYVESS